MIECFPKDVILKIVISAIDDSIQRSGFTPEKVYMGKACYKIFVSNFPNVPVPIKYRGIYFLLSEELEPDQFRIYQPPPTEQAYWKSN